MSTPTVRCGGEWMDRWGTVGDVTWSSIWRKPADGFCGDLLASFSLGDVDPEFRPTFMAPGQTFQVVEDGAVLFDGRITEYVPGRPVQVHAEGWGTRTAWAGVYDSDPGTPGDQFSADLDVNKAVDAAIARGAGLQRFTDLNVDPADLPPLPEAGLRTLMEQLAFVANHLGKRVIIRGREVLYGDETTTPTWIWTPGDAVMPQSDQEWISRLWLIAKTYRPGSGETPADAIDRIYKAEDSDVVEHREATVDIRKLGPIKEAQAQADLAARFDAVKLRWGYTEPFSPPELEWRHISGAEVDTTPLRAGDMVRIHGVMADNANLSSAAYADVVAGKVEHRVGQAPRVEPLGLVARDLRSALEDAVEPEKESA